MRLLQSHHQEPDHRLHQSAAAAREEASAQAHRHHARLQRQRLRADARGHPDHLVRTRTRLRGRSGRASPIGDARGHTQPVLCRPLHPVCGPRVEAEAQLPVRRQHRGWPQENRRQSRQTRVRAASRHGCSFKLAR